MRIEKTKNEKVQSIINVLNKWIMESENNAEKFENSNMHSSSLTAQAMAQAYWNVKQLIEVNLIEK